MPKYYKLNNSRTMYLNTSFGCLKNSSITSTITTQGSGYTSAPTVDVISNDGGSEYHVHTRLQATTVSTTITIVSGGTNYVVGDTVVFDNTGTGGGSGVAATVSAVSAGVITALNFSSQGSGYTIRAPTMTTITSTAGTGANITFRLTATGLGSLVQINNGKNYSVLPTLSLSGSLLPTSINGFTSLVGGSGYALPPLISVSNAGSGTGFSGLTTLTPTTVSSTNYTIVSGGTGYIVGDVIVFNNTGTGGSGVVATVSAVSGGAITAINFSSQGSGYTIRAPVMTAITSTAGINGLITFTLTPTSVGSITIINGGRGYTTPTFTFTPVSGGTGASATPTVISGTEAVITPEFFKTFTYTWNDIPSITINDMGKLIAFNLIADNFVATTPYTYRILGVQYDSRNSFFSDYGAPIVCMTENTNITNYGILGGPIILTPQTICSITISVDDSISTRGSGQSANINFILALEINEYDPDYTEIGDVYGESASRLKLNY